MTASTSQKLREPQKSAYMNERADAVRYAVLQRIAPALRHDMVVNLQPIGMIHELIQHRVAHQQADIAGLHESTTKMTRFAKAALSACSDTATWLERDPRAVVELVEGVGECVALLNRAFGFMGFNLINEVRNDALQVPRDAIRHTLIAALLAAVDTADVPSDVVLRSTLGRNDLALSLVVVPQSDKRVLQVFEEAYRRLTWPDVEAVAVVESIRFAKTSGGATLFFAR